MLKAVIFDLDGVLTDTAEQHYDAWLRMATEEGLTFTREENDRLRGLSRRESLLAILKGRQLTDAAFDELMVRKNSYFQESLAKITPADLFPGIGNLLDEMDAAGVPYGLASASRNAPTVVAKLGIADRLAVIGDGSSVERGKPAPDIFLYVAKKMGIEPEHCLVVEDAAAGVQGAQAAGMAALAVGPAGRFGPLLERSRICLVADMANVKLVDLQAIAAG